ncbi:MAG: hypothetical protein K9M10_03800 [Candidatus Pacebacteria bacterium]|nr:hypothetical protein [Candidatus Paceibacterota bacterium]MCF7857576.1 hypothetical protein [Candidatus Paceibacterota bacterium]
MKQKILIFGGVAVAVIIVGVLMTRSSTPKQEDQKLSEQAVAIGEPVDVALDFYNLWLDARKAIDTDPYQSGLANKEFLSKELQARLIATQGRVESEADPVLCQVVVPKGGKGRVVSQDQDGSRILITAKDKELTGQAIFTLLRHNDGWFINNIECAPGEFDLPREFSFEKEGFILKSVPPPLNPEYWHLVFEENGELGHFVPLFFDEASSCTSFDGEQTTCTPDQFVEAKKAHAYGQMTELGVEVKRLEFLE